VVGLADADTPGSGVDRPPGASSSSARRSARRASFRADGRALGGDPDPGRLPPTRQRRSRERRPSSGTEGTLWPPSRLVTTPDDTSL
jgi:hypothetical protein